MTQAFDSVRSFIVASFNDLMAGIAAIEGFLADLMTQAGFTRDLQKPLLTVALVLLILAAFRLFGRFVGVMIAIFLVLLLVQALAPGVLAPSPHAPG